MCLCPLTVPQLLNLLDQSKIWQKDHFQYQKIETIPGCRGLPIGWRDMGVQVNPAGGHTGKIAKEIPSTHYNFHAFKFNTPFNIFNEFEISF